MKLIDASSMLKLKGNKNKIDEFALPKYIIIMDKQIQNWP